MNLKKIPRIMGAVAILGLSTTLASHGKEEDLQKFEDAADKLHDALGGGKTYSKATAKGPYLIKGSRGGRGTLKWIVTTDARGKNPMSNQLQIGLTQYFKSIDPAKISITSRGDGVKHGDRLVKDKPAVARSFTLDKGVFVFNQTINFRARWFHYNTAFPRTDIVVEGQIEPDAEVIIPKK